MIGKSLKRLFRQRSPKLTQTKCLCRSLPADDSSSCTSSGESDSGSSVYSWMSLEFCVTKNEIDELLEDLPFYYGSMLDDTELQTQLLAKQGDSFLVAFPLSKNDIGHRSTAYNKWHLVILEPNKVVCKMKVVHRDGALEIASQNGLTLMTFINEWGLNPITRPWNINPSQLTSKMAIIPQQAFAIDSSTFPLGFLQQGTLNFDSLRRIPAMQFFVTTCKGNEIDRLLLEAENRKNFGSV